MIGLLGSPLGGTFQPAFPLYQALEKTRAQQLAAFERQPLIARESAYFLEQARKVETVDDFLADRRLMAVALSAYGLEEEIQYLGRMRKVLTEPVADPDSLANKLIDPRFKKIAEAFRFAERGTFNLGLTSFLNEVVDKYTTNEFERFLGAQNPALREVEYFRRNIAGIDNTFNILGDRVLREVVTVALRLPREIVFQSIDKQKALIEARLDIEDFQDPDFVETFARRYLILKDAEGAQAGFAPGFSSTAPNAFAVTLLAGAGGKLDLLA